MKGNINEDYIEMAKNLFIWGVSIATTVLGYLYKGREMLQSLKIKFENRHVFKSQFYKTLVAKSENTFQKSVDDIYNGVEGSVIINIAKIKNGYKIFLPDSDATEVVKNHAGHIAGRQYIGDENEHPLDPAFYGVAAQSMAYGGALLKLEDLENQEYKDFLNYVGYSCVRIYNISFNDDVSYFLYVCMADDRELTYKEKHLINQNLSKLKGCFSKKNFVV